VSGNWAPYDVHIAKTNHYCQSDGLWSVAARHWSTIYRETMRAPPKTVATGIMTTSRDTAEE